MLGNIIAHNLGVGIQVNESGSGADLVGDNVFDNGGLGIDLGGDGGTPNDANDAELDRTVCRTTPSSRQ